MTFQFLSDTVGLIFLLKYVKYLIIINNQSLNYGVKYGCVLSGLWRSLFTNVYKCDIIITSSAAMKI